MSAEVAERISDARAISIREIIKNKVFHSVSPCPLKQNN